jgi:zinc/manganese transport system substrate-binding protein/zinc transport system substrate-binding protein
MRNRWKLLAGSPIVALALGCGGAKTADPNPEKLDVLCSFFPVYLFTKNVVGDTPNVSVSLMLPSEMGCPHDYDLKPQDVKRIAGADLFVVNGGGLEEFTELEVKKAIPRVVVVDSSKGIVSLKPEDEHDHDHDHAHESKETKAHKHDHDHDHKEAHDHKHDHDHKDGHDEKDHDHAHKDAHKHDHGDHDHDHDHGHDHGGVNPHFFTSPRAAAQQAINIGEALAKADPKNAEAYRKNAAAYSDRLKNLGSEFETLGKQIKNKKIVTMHEVFDYLAKDCGLEIVATIHSSPGHDPSAGQLRKVIEQIKKSGAAAVFTEPQYSPQAGKTVAKDAGVPVHSLDPVASGPSSAGADYYEKTMRGNLEVLRQTLASPAK